MDTPSFGPELDVTIDGESAATESSAGRIRRRLAALRGRLAGLTNNRGPAGTADDEPEAELELMLLREQNMRLLSDRHRPFDLGMLLEQLRLRLSATDITSTDEAWTLLSECLLIRENLDQASAELEAAIGLMRARLAVGGAERELEQIRAAQVPVADAA